MSIVAVSPRKISSLFFWMSMYTIPIWKKILPLIISDPLGMWSTQRESFTCDWVLTIISLMSKHQQQQSYPTLHQLILSISKEIRLHHFQKEIARGLGINLWYSISLSIMIFSEDLGSETSRCTTEVSVGGSNVAWYTSVEQREMIIVWNNSAFR